MPLKNVKTSLVLTFWQNLQNAYISAISSNLKEPASVKPRHARLDGGAWLKATFKAPRTSRRTACLVLFFLLVNTLASCVFHAGSMSSYLLFRVFVFFFFVFFYFFVQVAAAKERLQRADDSNSPLHVGLAPAQQMQQLRTARSGSGQAGGGTPALGPVTLSLGGPGGLLPLGGPGPAGGLPHLALDVGLSEPSDGLGAKRPSPNLAVSTSWPSQASEFDPMGLFDAVATFSPPRSAGSPLLPPSSPSPLSRLSLLRAPVGPAAASASSGGRGGRGGAKNGTSPRPAGAFEVA